MMRSKVLSYVDSDQLFTDVHKNDYYFYLEITPRFADFIQEGELHFSKHFEYFEMARFSIFNQFEQYRTGLEKQESSIREQIYFVVVKADYENVGTATKEDAIMVRTRFIPQKIPFFEFQQTLMNTQANKIFARANIKIALVDTNMKSVKRWDEQTLAGMLSFIPHCGKKEG